MICAISLIACYGYLYIDVADRILNNLITAVNNLRDNADGNNTSPNVSQRQQTTATSESTSQALRRLYPSIDQLPVQSPQVGHLLNQLDNHL